MVWNEERQESRRCSFCLWSQEIMKSSGRKKLFFVAILWTELISALGSARLANAEQDKHLEVFSWWTSGEEAMALESLFHVYKYYKIKVGNTLSFEQFFSAAQKLKAAGVVPLAMGDAGLWATAEMFENTLLGVLGPKGWQELFGGQMMFDDPRVKEAVRLYGRMLDYQNTDHSALSWDQAVRRVIHGKAAFTAMGDWAYGELVKAGLKGNQDFGWVSFPGTEGTFSVVADGFTLAKGARNLDEAVAWLEMVGSKEAQEAFNALKGSIPVRTDVDKGKLDIYQQWSMASFHHDALLASCVQGEAAPATFQQELNDAISMFVADRNVERFTGALVQAARASSLSK